MFTNILFDGNVGLEQGGREILDGLVTDIMNQDDLTEQNKAVLNTIGATRTPVLNPDQRFGEMYGIGELSEKGEFEPADVISIESGNSKGYKVKTFSGQIVISGLIMDWLRTGVSLANADSSVQQEWAKISNAISTLRRSAIRTKNIEYSKILVDGRKSSNAYGPGSLGPDGQPLFSDTHYIMDGTSYNSNYLGSQVLSASSSNAIDTSRGYIKDAIERLNSGIRLQNGDYITQPNMYQLRVPRALAITAREVLNSGSKSNPTANNAGAINIFSMDGSMVELVVDPTIGMYDKHRNMIGRQDSWFVQNVEMAKVARAVREFELGEIRAGLEYDGVKDVTTFYIHTKFAIDHYGLDKFIVGANLDE